MPNMLIAPTKGLGYSNFYLDFLAGRESARNFFATQSLADAAARLGSTAYQRDQLAEILIRQNQSFGASDRTMTAIERLRDPQSVCVFAGQQAGLFGGPMMTLIKALAIVKLAASYTAELNRPVIPVFWIAGDDHDFAEANHTWLLNREAEPTRIAYDAIPQIALPMGETRFAGEDALNTAKNAFKNCLGQTDFTAELYHLVDQTYTTGDTLVSAFGKLMAHLTADYGLVLFNPTDPAAKSLAAPFFKQVLAKQDEVHGTIEAANKRLQASGYHLQVQKTERATHLFVNLDGRKPLLKDGGYTVSGRTFSDQDLSRLIDSEPERFSPDALLRPVMQSYLFPVVGQIGGPAEIAYFAQMNGLFELMNLPAPFYKQRASATLVETRFEKLMTTQKITFEGLTGDIEQVINRVLAETFPHNIEKQYKDLREDVATRFDNFSKQSLTFDPQLGDFAKQTHGKIEYLLNAFEGKVFSSHKKKSQESRDRIYRLWHSLYPNQGLQERGLNISYFVARYGFGVISYLFDRLEADQTAHQLISLSEYTN